MPTEIGDSKNRSGSDDDDNYNELVGKRIKLIRELSELERPRKRFTGGIVFSSEADEVSASASLSAVDKRGLKEVKELERELDLKNTFSKETNRRDEDAEMNKYIDEQIRLRREAAKLERQRKEDDLRGTRADTKVDDHLFVVPADAASERVDDILLHNLAKNMTSRKLDERSEAMLSSHMLNNIPEVELSEEERRRVFNEPSTRRSRQSAGSSSTSSSRRVQSTARSNYSSNYQAHRSSHHTGDRHHSSGAPDEPKVVVEPVVSVGEKPNLIEYRVPSSNGNQRLPPKGKASDDYFLKKFKRNNRR